MDVEPADGPSRRAWLRPTLLATAVIALAAGFAQFSVTTVLGDVAVAFGEAEEEALAQQVGLSATTLGIGLAAIRLAALGSLLPAALADRFGRRRLLLGFMAGGLALTALAAGSPGFWVFVGITALARPLLTGSNALVQVIAAEQATTADRSKAIALMAAAYGGGAGLVALIRGIGETPLGFRPVFALALVPLLGLPLLARFLRESPLFHRQERPALPGAVERSLWGRLAIVCGLGVATSVVTGPGFTYLFVFGENVLGASAAFMAALVLLAGPVGLVGLLVGRWTSDHWGRRLAAAIAGVLVALAATVAYSGSVVMLAVGYELSVLAAAAVGPPAGALLAEVFPTRARATANGWFVAAGVVGAVLGLAAFGALADVFGSFATAGAALWLPTIPMVGLYALLPETRYRELDAEDVTAPS